MKVSVNAIICWNIAVPFKTICALAHRKTSRLSLPTDCVEFKIDENNSQLSSLCPCLQFYYIYCMFLLYSKIDALQNQLTAASQSTEPLRKVSAHAQFAVHM